MVQVTHRLRECDRDPLRRSEWRYHQVSPLRHSFSAAPDPGLAPCAPLTVLVKSVALSGRGVVQAGARRRMCSGDCRKKYSLLPQRRVRRRSSGEQMFRVSAKHRRKAQALPLRSANVAGYADQLAGDLAGSVDYGERYRNGERISTSFVEPAINQVVSKRMVRKQQMPWTPAGIRLLLRPERR